MTLHMWLLYLVAAIGLSLTPGPNSLLALTHGVLDGHRRTLFAIGGGTVGFVALMGLSMLGIGALLQTSAHALAAMKLLGGLYLIWLGLKLWRSPPMQLQVEAERITVRRRHLFRRGLLTAASNPKVLLFYGAFLPQFIDPARPLLEQFAIMAATFGVIEFVVEYLIARTANVIRPWLQRVGKRFNQACGSLFVLLGVALPLTR